MTYQVTRTDTGQFVLIDPATDTVIIDDELVAGFTKLEEVCAQRPLAPRQPGPKAASDSPFAFRGGPRYTPILLAIVLPFLWLGALYFALADLLAEHALDRQQAQEVQEQVQALEHELQALRSEMAGAPRTGGKPKPKPKPGAGKPASKSAPAPSPASPSVPAAKAAPAKSE